MSEQHPYNPHQQRVLLDVAKSAIAYGVEHHRRRLPVDPARFDEALRLVRATFVTLRIAGRLRGCMGVLEACRPLIADAAHNAYNAAFSDPRFEPVTSHEAPLLDVHISVLSEPVELTVADEAALLASLRPGEDGLILEHAATGRRATFLPAVWETIADPTPFLAHLKAKARIEPDEWPADLRVFRYTAQSFPEEH